MLEPSRPSRYRKITDKYVDVDGLGADAEAVRQCMSGSISGTSEPVIAYESKLAAWFESSHAVALSSGGAAVLVALHAAGVGPGDEVILTPTAPLCTVYPIMELRAKPVFCDTQAENFSMDLDDLARSITPRTKAIIDIPMWGYPTPADALRDFAKSRGVKLVFDLAHAHGTTLHGKHLSAYADISCFSTHERKPLATGEGGFVLTDDAGLSERARLYSRFGNLAGVYVGLNFKLGGMQAALGASRIGRLSAQIARRRENARALLQKIEHPSVRELSVVPGGDPNHYSALLHLAFQDNTRFLRHLDAAGIPSDILRYGGKCLYRFPAVEAYTKVCPNAERLLGSITTIPVHPQIGPEDIDHIASVINDYSEVSA